MGMLLTDAVAAAHPEHTGEGHVLRVEGEGQEVVPINRDILRPAIPVNWMCSCGAVGVLEWETVGELLRAGKVVTF